MFKSEASNMSGVGESGHNGQGVGMVGAEPGPPALEHPFANRAAAGAVSYGLQIVGDVQNEVPGGGRVVPLWGGGEHVRGQPGVAGPASWILWVAGGCGGQQRQCLVDGGLLAVWSKAVADDRLHQPVHLKAVGVAAGQRVADHRADGVGEAVGVDGGGAQRLVEQLRVADEQRQWDGVGGEEGGQFQQLDGGRIPPRSRSSDSVQVVSIRPW
jgi:hypothetical protein